MKNIPKLPILRLCLVGLCLWSPQAAAEIAVLGNAHAPPLSEVLPALRVQTPEEEQRVLASLPSQREERIRLVQRILAEQSEVSVVLWIAPEDAPYEGQGLYALSVARRLSPGGIERVRVDAETGEEGARLAALRVAELVETAPEPTAPEQGSQQVEGADAPERPKRGGRRQWKLEAGAGAALRLEPSGPWALVGAEVYAGVERPWLPLQGVSAGASVVLYPAISYRSAPPEVVVSGLDVLGHVRWLNGEALLWGAEASFGARRTAVAAVTVDDFDGTRRRWSPLVAGHLDAGWALGRFRIVGAAGAGFSTRRTTYEVDGRTVFAVSGWAPSFRVRLEGAF